MFPFFVLMCVCDGVLFLSLLVLWPRNQQGSSVCSLILWFLPECGSLLSAGRLPVVLSWVTSAVKGHLCFCQGLGTLESLWRYWYSNSRKCPNCSENWTGFTGSRVACDVFSFLGPRISEKENSTLETSEGYMPGIYAVFQKQDIIEAFSQAETDVVPCYCHQC